MTWTKWHTRNPYPTKQEATEQATRAKNSVLRQFSYYSGSDKRVEAQGRVVKTPRSDPRHSWGPWLVQVRWRIVRRK